MLDGLVQSAKTRMQKAVDVTVTDLSTIRSGRASPALVENIMIAAYEGTQKLKVLEMATISAQDAKTITVAPYDPSQIQSITKGIQEANTGLNPVIDGELIRISIPPLSEERRRDYIKLAKTKIEAGKIMIRQVRQDTLKELRRAVEDKLLNEDDQHLGEKLIQESTDLMGEILTDLEKKKEAELLQI